MWPFHFGPSKETNNSTNPIKLKPKPLRPNKAFKRKTSQAGFCKYAILVTVYVLGFAYIMPTVPFQFPSEFIDELEIGEFTDNN